VLDRKIETAERVIAGDERLDAKEIEVEGDVLKILALHQPVAADLRFLVAVLKVNNDLERIGDLAKNIAKRARDLARAEWPEAPSRDLRKMMKRVQRMLKHALDALVRLDSQAARAVCREDDEVDLLLKDVFHALEEEMIRQPKNVPQYLATLSVARHLERIADLATNIAEDVVFTVEGEVIRHGGGEELARVVPIPRN
ncbi:MAG: phosphate signaling complex protein PhoU, partial [Gemmatimonadetes bacterium]|nr:phosphate signaling complex protein PhoU [Gemmatimonadota bacterium]